MNDDTTTRIWQWFDDDMTMIWWWYNDDRWYDNDDEIGNCATLWQNQTFQNWGHAAACTNKMLPACRCMARFLKGQLDILKSLPQSSSRVGPYYDGIGVMVVGRWWSAGHRRGRKFWNGGKKFWWTQKVCATAGPKIEKARQTVPLAQRKEPMPPLDVVQ